MLTETGGNRAPILMMPNTGSWDLFAEGRERHQAMASTGPRRVEPGGRLRHGADYAPRRGLKALCVALAGAFMREGVAGQQGGQGQRPSGFLIGFERARVHRRLHHRQGLLRDQLRRRREMFVPLHHAPGHAQADFGEALVVIGGIEQKARFFALDLPQSDASYIRPIQRQR
jgi:hypothetical protein